VLPSESQPCPSPRIHSAVYLLTYRYSQVNDSFVPAPAAFLMAKGKRSKAVPPTGSTPAHAAAASASVTPPSWPPFRPSLPITDLVQETVVPDKVVVYRSFFPRSLARDYVSFLRELPLTTTPGKPKRGEALRVNDRYQIDDARFANRLWNETGLKDAILDPDRAHLW